MKKKLLSSRKRSCDSWHGDYPHSFPLLAALYSSISCSHLFGRKAGVDYREEMAWSPCLKKSSEGCHVSNK